MSILEYIENKKAFQQELLNYLDEGTDDDFEKLIKLNLAENRYDLKITLKLLNSIVKNHYRSSDFFPKIQKILLHYQSNIKKNLSAKELIKIFYSNKIIILYLLEQKTISVKDILDIHSLYAYFYPELEDQLNNSDKDTVLDTFQSYGIDYDRESFIKNRQLGENESYICSLIRKDSVVDFISHVTRNNITLSNKIKESLFETHSYLIKRECNLIGYAAFFCSIQIFQYLKLNNVKLSSSIWFYAIHGNNPEIIHILEEQEIEPKEKPIVARPNTRFKRAKFNNDEPIKKFDGALKCLIESIKCHHINISEYLKDKLFNQGYNSDEYSSFVIPKKGLYDENSNSADSIFRCFNFYCFPEKLESYFMFLCKYDYATLVEFLINSGKIDINKKIVFDKNRF